jgi:predicted Zn-dependent protease
VLRYGRRDEREADREGMRLLATAGVDPQGMVRFFETLQRETPDVPSSLAYLSTHPRTETRIAELRQLADSLVSQPRPLPVGDWAAVRQACITPTET